MDTREFIASVVPWNTGDYVNIHWLNLKSKSKGGMSGRSAQTIDEFLTILDDLQRTRSGVEIYFCISSQRISGERRRENASYLCCAAIDMDVRPGDPLKYQSIEEAVDALVEFCTKLRIPKPSIVVYSGGGLHVYWLSNKALTLELWKPFAVALKSAALAFGLKCDAGVTGNAAGVLRLPGTKNYKYTPPRNVEVLAGDGSKYDFAVIFKDLPADQPKDKIQVAEAFAHLDPKQPLAEGIFGALPIPFKPIKDGCPWLCHVHDSHGVDQSEPLWHDAIRCSIFLEGGEQLIHEFSSEHPDYDAENTNEKFARAYDYKQEKDLGWPKCKTICDNGAQAFCKACPHLAKDRSPLALGLVAAVEVVRDKELGLLGGVRPPSLRLPAGFCLNEKGQLCAFIPASKKVHAHLMMLVSNRVRDPNIQRCGDQTGISFIAEADRGREIEVFLDANSVYRETGLLRMLPKNNLIYNPDPKAKVMVERLFKSWLDLLKEEDTPTIRDSSMGWKHENGVPTGFVYGGKLYRADCEPMMVPQNVGDAEFYSWYMPKGAIDPWYEAAKLLTDRKRPELDILLTVPFAAPLTVFAGAMYGVFLSIWGEPGTSKSTAQHVAAAMWGHPKQTRESLNSTPKSVQGRLGRTKNLAAYWDDIQDERHQQLLFDNVFVTTEGMEGGRLNPDATYKQRLEWQSMVVTCANASFIDYLIQKQKSTTAGMRRVFEFEFNKKDEPGIINPIAASRIFAQLEHNYGHVGAVYAQMLAQNHKEINKMVAEITDRFRTNIKGTSDESFWWGLCGLLLTGAILARRVKVDVDVDAMELFLMKAFLQNRKLRADEATEGGTLANTEKAVTDFLNHYLGSGNVIYTVKPFENRHTPVAVLCRPNVGRPIYIQVVRDARIVLIAKRAFKLFMADNDIRSRQVLDGMVKFFHAKEARHTLGAGTDHTQTQELCLEFVVPVGPGIFDAMISAFGIPKTSPQLVPGATRDPSGT